MSSRRGKRMLPNQSLDDSVQGFNSNSNNGPTLNSINDNDQKQERLARFSAVKSENRYLEMKKERISLTEMYIKQGKLADPNHVYQLDQAINFVAECMDMCPEFEREEREFTNYLEPFEKIPGTDRVDHQKAVKRYKRSAAGDPPPLPCDVRPPKILFKTLDYLFHQIIGEHGVAGSHSFVRDRARSIRNDLTLQNYRGIEAVILHERIARYHIMCSNLLCGSEGFVMQQEEEQLRKTLLSLMEFYSELSAKGQEMPNEPEFQAYYILTLPWSNDVPTRLEQELSPKVFFHPQVQLALKIRFLMTRREERNRPSVDGSLNHYARIFSLIRNDSMSYLLACCIHLHFADIRKSAIRAIQKSYHYFEGDANSGMDLNEIVESLGFDDHQDAIKFLNHYFIDVGDGSSGKVAYVGRKVITDAFGRPKPGDYPKYPYTLIPDNSRPFKSDLIESKRKGISYIDILDGKYVSLSSTTPNNPVIFSPVKQPSIPSFLPSVSSSIPPAVIPPPSNASDKPAFSFASFASSTTKLNPTAPEFIPSATFTPQKPLFPTSNMNTPALSAPTLFAAPPSFTPSNGSIPLTQEKKSVDLRSSIGKRKVDEPISELKPPPLFTVPTPMVSTIVPSEKKPTLPLKVEKTLVEKFDIVQEDILSILLEPSIQQVVKEVLNTQLDKRMRMRADVSLLLLEDFLNEIIHEVAHDRISTNYKLGAYRLVLKEVASDLINQVTKQMLYRIIKPEITAKRHIHRYQRFGWDRWQYFVFVAKFNRKRQQLIGRKMLSHLRQSALTPPDYTAVPDMGVVQGTDEMIEKRLSDVANEMAEKRATWYERIRFESQVLPFVSASLGQHYKIIFSTCLATRKLTGSLGWFSDTWTKSKLSTQSVVPGFVDQPFMQGDSLSLILNETYAYDHNESIKFLLYYCDDTYLQNSARQHNSLSLFSGSNAAIFQCDYFSSANYQSRQDYWDQLSHSISKFATSFPEYASIPLVLVYWPNTHLTEKQFASLFESKIEYFRMNLSSPFSKVSVLYLDVSTEHFDSDLASRQLCQGMIWLLDNARLEPTLKTDIISFADKITKKYEWSIKKIEELLPNQLYPIPKLQSLAGSKMVQIYNAFLNEIVDLLTDPEHLKISFPAQEFAPYPLDWNSISSFTFLKEALHLFLLPVFPDSDSNLPSINMVINMFIHYIDQIYQIPSLSCQDLDHLKHSIIKNPKNFFCSQVFLQIGKLVLQLFSAYCSLPHRPFSVSIVQERISGNVQNRFLEASQRLVTEFYNDEARKVELTPTSVTPPPHEQTNTRKRKIKEDSDSIDISEKNPQTVMERLKKAMEDAKLFLSKS